MAAESHDKQVQSFRDEDCDEGPKSYTTTSGPKKEVKFDMTADDGALFISLVSQGCYRIKIGFRYTGLDQEGKRGQTLPRYHEREYFVSEPATRGRWSSFTVPNGWNADVTREENDANPDIGEWYPFGIDIIELVSCDD